ncbi:unnamed protein product [Ilex paraguariensis]|uniref:Uncharacterized protein n=1 Tax=Ilex paraguariensis TaxID=185542 RepID=A0ABC8U8V2_9AQUA
MNNSRRRNFHLLGRHRDIHEAPRDQKIESLFKKIEFIHSSLKAGTEIMSAGKEFTLETIKTPFLCVELRLLDGQFKNTGRLCFWANWAGSYLAHLARDSDALKLFVLREEDALVERTMKKVVAARRGMKFGFEKTVCSCASLGFGLRYDSI